MLHKRGATVFISVFSIHWIHLIFALVWLKIHKQASSFLTKELQTLAREEKGEDATVGVNETPALDSIKAPFSGPQRIIPFVPMLLSPQFRHFRCPLRPRLPAKGTN